MTVDIARAKQMLSCSDYLNEHGIIFQCMSRVWDNFDGDTTTIAWLENGEVHMLQWEVDYR